jgi:hypothetical protein
VDVRRYPNWPAWVRGRFRAGLRRLAVRLWGEDFWPWLVRVRRAEPPDDAPVDLVYSRSEPGVSHLAALGTAGRGRPWVAHFDDPWAVNPYRRYVPPGARHREAEVVARADALVFPTEELRDLYDAAYPHDGVRERAAVIPHGFEPELYPAPRRGAGGPVRLVHVGDFYGLRSPEPLLRGTPPGVEVRLVGRVARQFDVRGAVCTGQVGYRQSLQEMVDADVLVVVDAPLPGQPFLPSKLVDYLGARRPVVGLTTPGSPTARLLERYGFPVADVRRPDQVQEVLEASVRHRESLAALAASHDYREYRMAAVVARLEDLFARLTGRGA